MIKDDDVSNLTVEDFVYFDDGYQHYAIYTVLLL